MRLMEPSGRPHIECPKCRTYVVWPSGFTAEQKAALAVLVRSGTLEGFRYAHEALGLDLREAKALSYHITRSKGICHRCKSEIAGQETVCTKCQSANLDW